MHIPVLYGIIDRRMRANFHITPAALAQTLPQPFCPKIVNGYAIGGICLIRLKAIRPLFLPFTWNLRSENAAHRFAVEWDVDGEAYESVYIPRRDTNSQRNTLAGSRIFPGIHHHAAFTVKESQDYRSVTWRSDDDATCVYVSSAFTDQLPSSSVFSSVAEASEFFLRRALGYSATQNDGRYDGLELRCKNWRIEALAIESIETSYFEDGSRFPSGSIEIDCALLMRDIHHEWHERKELCCSEVMR